MAGLGLIVKKLQLAPGPMTFLNQQNASWAVKANGQLLPAKELRQSHWGQRVGKSIDHWSAPGLLLQDEVAGIGTGTRHCCSFFIWPLAKQQKQLDGRGSAERGKAYPAPMQLPRAAEVSKKGIQALGRGKRASLALPKWETPAAAAESSSDQWNRRQFSAAKWEGGLLKNIPASINMFFNKNFGISNCGWPMP
jgi:hypothetical protein